MPSPTSPLARIRTIAWYHALQSHLQTTTYFSTAESLYDLTYDESITPDQCAKWAKGQRCSATWITRINKHLPASISDMYNYGPNAEPLWHAFDLPSSYRDDTLLAIALIDHEPGPIRQLVLALAAFMHAAELCILDSSTSNVQVSARGFFEEEDFIGKEDRMPPSIQLNLTRQAALRNAHQRLHHAADKAQENFPLAVHVPEVAAHHFIFNSKRYHPKNTDASYLFKSLRITS